MIRSGRLVTLLPELSTLNGFESSKRFFMCPMHPTQAAIPYASPCSGYVRNRAFWFISIGAMLWGWAYAAGLIHQVAFAMDMGIDRVAAAGAVGLLTAFSILGRLGFGRLGDVIDKRYVFMMGASLQIVAFIVLMRTTNLSMLYLYSLLLGINLGGEVPILPGLIADYFGRKHFGLIYGVTFFMLTLGAAIGPIYGGWIFDITGSYSASFLTSILLSVIAIIVVYLAGSPRRQSAI